MSESDVEPKPDLPEGVDAGKLTEAVRVSGYPLQTVVARELNAGFSVVEEWGFVDRTSQEHRSLDIFAYRRLSNTSARLEPSLCLLVECKRSDLPYVFFAAAIPAKWSGFPSVVGFPGRKFQLHQEGSSIEVLPADFLRCSDYPFVTGSAPLAVTFSRVERKSKDLSLSGEVPYRTVVLPLASALEHYRDSRGGVLATQQRFFPTLVVCLCVVDASLVLASGTPESPDLQTATWVRLVREEALREGNRWERRQYVVDVVQRGFLHEYLAGHLVPFAEQAALRMIEREDILVAGKGRVPSWENWTWDEMKPV